MILYARCENYRSIGEKQTISFVANSDKSHNNKLIEEDNLQILPVIPIYGGNATGKTNVLKFLKTLVEIVSGKIDIESAYDPCMFYKEKKETTFELVFIVNTIKYYYKISYTNISIEEEGLYYYPNGKISKIFDRKKFEYSFGNSFESDLAKYSENLSEKACFLNTISNFLGKSIKNLNDIINFFKDSFAFINFDATTYNLEKTKEIFKKNHENSEKIMLFLNYFYKHMNVGVKSIKYVTLKPEEIEFSKNNKNSLIEMILSKTDKLYLVYETKNGVVEIPINEESEGIQKLFTLGMPISEALCSAKIVIFDELEIGFHPLLSRKIVELFLSNKAHSQLIFTTHNTNLLDLDLFRRDQIYFSSRTKDSDFKTVIKTLSEIPGIRKSADIEKAYLEGKYSSASTYELFRNEDFLLKII